MTWITSMVWLNWMRLVGKQIPLKMEAPVLTGAFLYQYLSQGEFKIVARVANLLSLSKNKGFVQSKTLRDKVGKPINALRRF